MHSHVNMSTLIRAYDFNWLLRFLWGSLVTGIWGSLRLLVIGSCIHPNSARTIDFFNATGFPFSPWKKASTEISFWCFTLVNKTLIDRALSVKIAVMDDIGSAHKHAKKETCIDQHPAILTSRLRVNNPFIYSNKKATIFPSRQGELFTQNKSNRIHFLQSRFVCVY